MTPLAHIIRQRIEKDGPMSVATFMELALRHPEHGYYVARDPVGAAGDFITAPEISQMFGEIIGAWTVDVWRKLGSPAKFQLAEIGPGRGTLIADVLRATRRVPDFAAAVQIGLIEINPVLIARQKEMLGDHPAHWVASLDDLRDGDGPLILLANEFLDVLPIRQFEKNGQERMVVVNDGKLAFSSEKAAREDSPAQHDCARLVADILKRRRGAALFIDYGYAGPAAGDTLQAVRHHKYIDVLEDIGLADITAHVDFTAFCKAAEGVETTGPVGQGAFLRALGIAHRANTLQAHSPQQADGIEKCLQRLTAPDEMGDLFKVVALYHGLEDKLEGFDVHHG